MCTHVPFAHTPTTHTVHSHGHNTHARVHAHTRLHMHTHAYTHVKTQRAPACVVILIGVDEAAGLELTAQQGGGAVGGQAQVPPPVPPRVPVGPGGCGDRREVSQRGGSREVTAAPADLRAGPRDSGAAGGVRASRSGAWDLPSETPLAGAGTHGQQGPGWRCGLLPSSRFRRRARRCRWLTMDSVPVSLSIPSRLLATFGLCQQERGQRGPFEALASPLPGETLAPPTCSAAHPPQAGAPRVLTGKRGAGSPRCPPSARVAGAGRCGRRWPESPSPSARPPPGPAVRTARIRGARGSRDQPRTQPHPHPAPAGAPATAPRLTQETTRPLKQGSLALSAEISSFTTLRADAP